MAYLPVNLVVLALLIRFHSRVRPAARVAAGFAGYTAALICAPLLDLAPDSAGTLGATLLLVAATGACDGLAQGALFGEAALLPPAFTHVSPRRLVLLHRVETITGERRVTCCS